MKTLDDARTDWMYQINGDGGHCPCCDRWGKIYARQFNSSMAKALIWLVGKGLRWTDVPNTAPKWLTRTNQLPTVRCWGLVVRRESEDRTVKHSGMWQPTRRGIAFASNEIELPSTVYTYNNKVVRYNDDLIRIQDAFKTRFDYEQVMLPVQSTEQGELWGD